MTACVSRTRISDLLRCAGSLPGPSAAVSSVPGHSTMLARLIRFLSRTCVCRRQSGRRKLQPRTACLHTMCPQMWQEKVPVATTHSLPGSHERIGSGIGGEKHLLGANLSRSAGEFASHERAAQPPGVCFLFRGKLGTSAVFMHQIFAAQGQLPYLVSVA